MSVGSAIARSELRGVEEKPDEGVELTKAAQTVTDVRNSVSALTARRERREGARTRDADGQGATSTTGELAQSESTEKQRTSEQNAV